MIETVKLSNRSILLRPYRLSDVEQNYQASKESTNEVWQWLEWCHPDLSIDDCRKFIEEQFDSWSKGTAYNFAIISIEDFSYLGGCGLTEIRYADRVASMAYWVRTSRTKQGIATATTRLLADFGFNTLKLNRLELVIATGNIASQRVAENAGAVREGVLRNRYEAHGKVQDAFMYSLIPQDLLRK